MPKQHKLMKLQEDIRLEKQKLHDELVSENKGLFRFMDILVALMILMNFGAVFITNVSVVHERQEAGEEIVLMEVNPIQAEKNNYQLHPEYKSLAKAFFFQSMYWFLLLYCYVHYRRNIYKVSHLTIMFATILFYISILGWDFFNDLGYWWLLR